MTKKRRNSLSGNGSATAKRKSNTTALKKRRNSTSVVQKVKRPAKPTARMNPLHINRNLGKSVSDTIKSDVIAISSKDPRGYRTSFWQTDNGPSIFIENLNNANDNTIQEIKADFDQLKESSDIYKNDDNSLPKNIYIKPVPGTDIDNIAKRFNNELNPPDNKLYVPFDNGKDGKPIRLILKFPPPAVPKDADTNKIDQTIPNVSDASLKDKTDNVQNKTNDNRDSDSTDLNRPRVSPRQNSQNDMAVSTTDTADSKTVNNDGPARPVLRRGRRFRADTIYRSPAQPRIDTKLMDLAAFKKGTKNKNLKGRSPEFKAIEQTFNQYHNQLETFGNTVQNIMDGIARPERDKLDRLDQKYKVLKKIDDANFIIDDQTKYVNDKVDEYLNTDDPVEKQKIQSEIDLAIEKVKNENQKIDSFNAEKEKLNNEIAAFDKEIEGMLNVQNSFLKDQSNKLNVVSRDLKDKLDNYLRSHSSSKKDQKLNTLGILANQLGNMYQDTARLEEVIDTITGIDKNNQLAKPMKNLDSGTASHVFIVETKGPIGNSTTNIGFAKRSIKANDPVNDTTNNLGISDGFERTLNKNPNLIARQVVSSRIDEALGLNVLASEVFSKSPAGHTIGITAKANGQEMRKKDENGKFIYPKFNLMNSRVQKGLSDLQIMDAITGQLDRHLGNIMIDNNTGQVTGIDNDMAFSIEKANVTSVNNTLRNQFTNTGKGLVYNQTQIHVDTADKILNLNVDDFRKILVGTEADPERLEPEAINFAVERFIAVHNQVRKLRDADPTQLIKDFEPKHYEEARKTGEVKGIWESEHSNYLTRAVLEAKVSQN